jgi:hypothetical protein
MTRLYPSEGPVTRFDTRNRKVSLRTRKHGMGKRRERFVSCSWIVHDTKLKMVFHSFYQYLYRNTTLQSKTHLVCLKIQQCKPDSGRLWMVIIPNTRQFGIDNVEMRQVLSALHQKNELLDESLLHDGTTAHRQSGHGKMSSWISFINF